MIYENQLDKNAANAAIGLVRLRHDLLTEQVFPINRPANSGLMRCKSQISWCATTKEKSRRNLNRYLKENPAIKAVYDFKQELMRLILTRVYGKSQAREQIPKFLDAIGALKMSNFGNLETLGNTLDEWKDEIVRMWRFSKTNSITEGLHRRMDEIQNRAYGMHRTVEP